MRWPVGTVLVFYCIRPYKLISGVTRTVCNATGTWSHYTNPPICGGIGEVVNIIDIHTKCSILYCRLSNLNVVKIFVDTCPPYPPVENAQLSYNKQPVNGRYPYNTRVTFTCNGTYMPTGPSQALCYSAPDWLASGRLYYLAPKCHIG